MWAAFRTSELLKTPRWWLGVIPPLLVLCSFGSTVAYEFVGDDHYLIERAAPVLQKVNLGTVQQAFKTDMWYFATQNLDPAEQTRRWFYRPLFVIFLMIGFQWAGLSPWKWHCIAIGLHAIASVLAYVLIYVTLGLGKQVSESMARCLAVFGAIMFALHPVQCESVAWVSGCVSPLNAIFLFSSLLVYVKMRRCHTTLKILGWMLLSLVFFSAALLTKEVAIVFFPILFAYEFWGLNQQPSWMSRFARSSLVTLPYFLITMGYFVLRILVLGGIGPSEKNIGNLIQKGVNPMVGVYTSPLVFLHYLKTLVYPFHLNAFYPVPFVFKPGLSNFYVPVLFLMLLGIAAMWLARNDFMVRLGLIWLVCPLLPVLNVVYVHPEAPVQDRYLYLSLIGVGLIAASAFWKLRAFFEALNVQRNPGGQQVNLDSWPSSVILLATTVVLVMVLTTIKQNPMWRTDWSFLSTGFENAPQSCFINQELGRLSKQGGDVAKALYFFENAMRNCPDESNPYYQLGLLYLQNGDQVGAEQKFKQVLQLKASKIVRATTYFNLGSISEAQGKNQQAVEYYQKGLATDPNNEYAPLIHKNLNVLRAKMNQTTQNEKKPMPTP